MKTALHYAAQEHRLDTVKVLVGIDDQHKEERTKKEPILLHRVSQKLGVVQVLYDGHLLIH